MPKRRANWPPNPSKESQEVRKLALEEAIRLKHDYLGAEHLLLGLASHRGMPPKPGVLDVMGDLNLERVRLAVKHFYPPGEVVSSRTHPAPSYLIAARKARDLYREIGSTQTLPEHLLYGTINIVSQQYSKLLHELEIDPVEMSRAIRLQLTALAPKIRLDPY